MRRKEEQGGQTGSLPHPLLPRLISHSLSHQGHATPHGACPSRSHLCGGWTPQTACGHPDVGDHSKESPWLGLLKLSCHPALTARFLPVQNRSLVPHLWKVVSLIQCKELSLKIFHLNAGSQVHNHLPSKIQSLSHCCSVTFKSQHKQ